MWKEIAGRFTSRKFILTVVALVLVTLDIAEATDVIIVLAPFIGLEGLSDAVERHKK